MIQNGLALESETTQWQHTEQLMEKKDTRSDEKMKKIEKSFWEEAEKYPGAAFSREGLAGFLGISVGYLANLDSRGKGPEGGYYSGRKKMYLKEPAIKWGIQRVGLIHD